MTERSDAPLGEQTIRDIFTVARFVGIPGEAIERFVQTLVATGYRITPVSETLPTEATEEMVYAAIHCLDGVNLLAMSATGNRQTGSNKEQRALKHRLRWKAMLAVALKNAAPQEEIEGGNSNLRDQDPAAAAPNAAPSPEPASHPERPHGMDRATVAAPVAPTPKGGADV